MASETLEIVIAARDQFTGTANRVIGSLNRMDTAAGRVGRGMGQMAGGLARIGALAGGAALAGIAASAKAFSDYQAGLNTINTIAMTTPGELDKIGQSIRALSRQGRGQLSDLTMSFYDIVSAGVKSADAMGVLSASTNLAIGGLSTTNEAVDILTTAINSYGQSASMAAKDADMFAKAIEIGKVKAPEIAASIANVAPVAHAMGIGLDEIAAAYGRLSVQGTPAAEVTTQMARSIIELNKPHKALIALQKETHTNYAKLAADKGLVPALEQMRIDAAKAKVPFQDLFGRIEAFKFAVQTTGPQFKAYMEALKEIDNSEGTAAAQAAERMKGLSFSFQKLKSNLLDAAITVGEGFAPQLAALAERLATFVDKNHDKLKAFGKDIGSALEGVNWDAVLAGAESFVGVLKTAFSIINSLPTEIKAAGAAFLGLNKLSGGLLGAGAGNILGGLLGAGARGIAAKAPGVGSLFAQPVFVTNWPMGGVGGGVGAAAGGGGWLANILKFVPAIAAATVAWELGTNVLVPQMQENAKTGADLVTSTKAFTKVATKTDLENALRAAKEQRGNPLFALGELVPAVGYLAGTKQAGADIDRTIAELTKAIEDWNLADERRGAGGPASLPGRSPDAQDRSSAGLRKVGQRIQAAATGRGSDAMTLAAGFAASLSPSLVSMNAHLAKIKELAMGTKDPAERKLLQAAAARIEALLAPREKEIAREIAGALEHARGERGAGLVPSVTVNTYVSVTERAIRTSATKQVRYGPSTGSAGRHSSSNVTSLSGGA